VYRIRRFGVVSTANTVALMYGLLFGVIFLVVGLVGGVAFIAGRGGGSGFALPSLVFGLAVGVIVYAVIFWLVTAFICVIYNAIAGRTGGIEIVLETRLPPAPPPGWNQYGPGVPLTPMPPQGTARPSPWAQPPGPPPGWGQPG
jgi:hypothetical protein